VKTKQLNIRVYLGEKLKNGGCIFLLASILMACNNVEPPLDMGYNYFPTDTGRYYIYNVDSIYIECANNINDTIHYQIKETYPNTFLDASNQQALTVVRYYRMDSSQTWTIFPPDVWWLKKTENHLEKTEENLAFQKMVFPVSAGFTWNGNAYNVLGAQDYLYGAIDISFNNGYDLYDSTITVYQRKDTSLIDHYFITETYARNLGMVDKLEINIQGGIVYDSYDTLPPAESCWQNIPPPYHWYQINILNRIRIGWIKRSRLVESGFE
jgi:hypothetical protein